MTTEFTTTLFKSGHVDEFGIQLSDQSLRDFCEALNGEDSPMKNVKHAECVQVGDHLELRVRVALEITYEMNP